MIISIDAVMREFVYDTGNGYLTVSFDSIKESIPWKTSGVVTVSYKNPLGQDCFTSISSSSFLENIAHHLPEHRDRATDYEQDVLAYKIYRLLQGETEEAIDAEVKNVYEQRVRLEERKKSHKKKVNESLVRFMEKKKAVMDRSDVLSEINSVVADTLECVRVITHFEDTGELLRIREDLTQRERMSEVWKMLTDLDADNVKYSIQLQEAKENLAFNQEALNADRDSLEVAKDHEKDKFQNGIERAGRMVQKYTDEVDTYQAQVNDITEKRRDLERSVVEVLKEIAVVSKNKFDELSEKVSKMPDYPDLGDAPDDVPEMGFIVSEEMNKMVAAAKDKDIPEVNLRNMTPELAKSALESKLAKTRKDL